MNWARFKQSREYICKYGVGLMLINERCCIEGHQKCLTYLNLAIMIDLWSVITDL